MSEKMTPKEYLLEAGWVRAALSSGKEFYRKNGQRLTLNAAVERQLELDRARMAFVLERSAVSLLLPTDMKELHRVVRPTVLIGPKEGA